MYKTFLAFALLSCCAPILYAQKSTAAVQNYLNAREREAGLVGRVLVANSDGILVDQRMPATSDVRTPSAFPIGPIAGQFAAVAVLQLEKEGKLPLNASLCAYVQDCPATWSKIQIRHLLTQASGLPEPDQPPTCGGTPTLDFNKLEKDLAAKPLLFAPGSQFQYNPVNVSFVWRVIAKASGQPAVKYMDARIFRPLGLKHTGFSKPNTDAAFPELNSTVDDLYLWQRALMDEGPLPKELRDQIFVAYVEGQAFGFKILREFDIKAAVQDSLCAPGSLSTRNYPDNGTTVIVWLANDQGATEISRGIGSILFGKRYPLNPSKPVH